MKINLPTKSFSFFKVVSGFIFLLVSLFLPIMAVYAYMIGIVVSRAHGLGAWISMWRAKRMTWKYIVWMGILIVVCSFFGFKIIPILTLAFITSLMFTFHFIYNEFDLQEEKRTFINLVSSFNPIVLMVLFLSRDFYHLNISINIFLAVSLILVMLELIYIKEINWFFIQTKILTIFILLSILLSFKASSVINLFLIYHYAFWFVYPVYKLHVYKREERDGFIMILVLLIFSSIYTASTVLSSNVEIAILEMAFRTFLVVTIIHILSTAPFGYLFGLPKPKYN